MGGFGTKRVVEKDDDRLRDAGEITITVTQLIYKEYPGHTPVDDQAYDRQGRRVWHGWYSTSPIYLAL